MQDVSRSHYKKATPFEEFYSRNLILCVHFFIYCGIFRNGSSNEWKKLKSNCVHDRKWSRLCNLYVNFMYQLYVWFCTKTRSKLRIQQKQIKNYKGRTSFRSFELDSVTHVTVPLTSVQDENASRDMRIWPKSCGVTVNERLLCTARRTTSPAGARQRGARIPRAHDHIFRSIVLWIVPLPESNLK